MNWKARLAGKEALSILQSVGAPKTRLYGLIVVQSTVYCVY